MDCANRHIPWDGIRLHAITDSITQAEGKFPSQDATHLSQPITHVRGLLTAQSQLVPLDPAPCRTRSGILLATLHYALAPWRWNNSTYFVRRSTH